LPGCGVTVLKAQDRGGRSHGGVGHNSSQDGGTLPMDASCSP
jgi:hypothetical protein